MIGPGRRTTGAGTDRVTLRVADLAGRLTDRDRHLCRLLSEHRVLTSHQLTHLAFNHLDTAEDRLRTLTRLGVLDRFRPRRDTGSAPYHYVLGPLGAATLAADQGISVAELGYRRATILAIAHSRQLPEIVAVNSFFCALTGHARQHPDIELARWLSQRRCHTIWGTLVRPHGFGRWRDHDSVLEFFLHYTGQEPMSQLIAEPYWVCWRLHRLEGKMEQWQRPAATAEVGIPRSGAIRPSCGSGRCAWCSRPSRSLVSGSG